MLRLRYERLRRGWSQTDLGRAAKPRILQSEISDIELGRRPTATQLRALARVFGVNPSYAHILLEEIPDSINPMAAARIAEALAGPLPADPPQRRDASVPEVPSPPSLLDEIRKRRGE